MQFLRYLTQIIGKIGGRNAGEEIGFDQPQGGGSNGDQDRICRIKSAADLTVTGEGHMLDQFAQLHLDGGLRRQDDGSVGERKRTDRSKDDGTGG